LQKVKILEEGGKRWVEGLFTCSQEDHLQEEEEGGGIQNYELLALKIGRDLLN